MSEQQPEGTTVKAETANVTVEAPAPAETGSQSQDGGSGGQETPSGLVAEDTKVEQGK